MDVNNIIALARTDTHTTEGNYPNTTAIVHLNVAYQRFVGKLIARLDENFFFEIWKRDAVAGQNNGEYPYPVASSSAAGMRKLIRLDVKPTPDYIHYVPAEEVDVKRLANPWEWYLTNQPKDSPIYFIADTSVFIAPQFSAEYVQSGALQLMMSGIKNAVDLAVGGSEATILVPTAYHHVLSLGLRPHIYRSRGELNEAKVAEQDFDNGMTEALDELTNRVTGSDYASVPYPTNLE